MYSLTVGADPEFFVIHRDGNKRKILPAVQFTKGTKEHVEKLPSGIAIHQDNITLELNFDPQDTRDKFIKAVTEAMNELRRIIYPNVLGLLPAWTFGQDEIEAFGPTAMEFRCDPEQNVWGDPNYREADPLVRSAGGHVHIGWTHPDSPASNEEQNQVALWADLLIGVPSVLQEEHALARMRRLNYGKPGSLRLKPYGLEYRTPGNEWLNSSESIGRMYDLVENCVDIALIKGREVPFTNADVSTIQHCINKSDPFIARMLMQKFKNVA